MGYFIGVPAGSTPYDDLIESPFSPIPAQRRHLTIVYIGDDPRCVMAKDVIKSLIEYRPFSLKYVGIDFLPSKAKPRYMVAVLERSPRLLRIRTHLMMLLEEKGIAPHDRYENYIPHISIAELRVKYSLELYRRMKRVLKLASERRGCFIVNKLVLYEARGQTLRPLAEACLSSR
ncbi:MAG: hypothetical protein DRN15_05750 [Thermoprotei archaeon]|nr:MAG: hypothetical protein DRN15_05750 [Thermoprotei archaeon]RLF24802.1 MAG: hypothetical protein DRM97_03020 [Thermoprotei archaeon]